VSRLRAIRLVAMREVIERGRSRGYILSLLFTVFLLGAGFILPTVIVADQALRLAVVEPVPAGLETALEVTSRAYDMHLDLSRLPDRAAADTALTDGSIDAALAVPVDLSGPGELIVKEGASSQVQAVTTGAVIAIRAAEAAPLLAPPVITALEPQTDADATAIIFANAGIVLMFIGIFTYGTWVLTGVVEEKQSRVVEVVLSTVRARDLLMGKVIGIGVLAIAQLAVLVAAGIAAAQLSGRLVLPPTTVGAVIQLFTWFMLGFALYATAMGFLGSLASRVDEASNASLPVTMTATACYIASLFVVQESPGGLLARVMTFFPPARWWCPCGWPWAPLSRGRSSCPSR
jgi:ABC-2 type transport system permease protein